MTLFKQIEIKVKMVPVPDEYCGAHNPDVAERIARSFFEGLDSERFISILFDSQFKVVGFTETARGCAESCPTDPRETFRAAVAMNAKYIILAHNHPSGEMIPSKHDIEATNRMMAAGDILGITVIDHLIIANNKCLSFNGTGRMSGGSVT